MKPRLARLVLRALNAAAGQPMPEQALLDAVALMSSDQPTQADIRDALGFCEDSQWVVGAQDELTGRHWTLTTAGKLRVAKL
jgi:hypothetical protein